MLSIIQVHLLTVFMVRCPPRSRRSIHAPATTAVPATAIPIPHVPRPGRVFGMINRRALLVDYIHYFCLDEVCMAAHDSRLMTSWPMPRDS